MAGNKDNEHGVVDGIDDVGGMEAVEFFQFNIEKYSVIALPLIAVSGDDRFTTLVMIHFNMLIC